MVGALAQFVARRLDDLGQPVGDACRPRQTRAAGAERTIQRAQPVVGVPSGALRMIRFGATSPDAVRSNTTAV
jgi:hypothetical protein